LYDFNFFPFRILKFYNCDLKIINVYGKFDISISASVKIISPQLHQNTSKRIKIYFRFTQLNTI